MGNRETRKKERAQMNKHSKQQVKASRFCSVNVCAGLFSASVDIFSLKRMSLDAVCHASDLRNIQVIS